MKRESTAFAEILVAFAVIASDFNPLQIRSSLDERNVNNEATNNFRLLSLTPR